MAIEGLGYIKTAWAFQERPVASSKLNNWDDRIEAAVELGFRLAREAQGGRDGVVRGATANDLRVRATPSPSLSVDVLPGIAWLNGFPIQLTSTIQTVDVLIPVTHPRLDLVQAKLSDWSVLIKTGTEAASPSAPNPDSGAMALAHLYLRPLMTVIKNNNDGDNGYIIDQRTFA